MPEGKLMSNYNNDLLTVSTCDINDPAALRNTVKGCRGVIYAASASKRGGSAKAIDNEGVVAAGDACIQGNIGRFVVISSTATSRPKSLGYIFTNVFGGVMEEKRKGEQGVMKQYKYATTSGSTYTILRPGGLEEPKENKVLGPSTLEISQGDAIAGIISRADLAQVAVELALCEQSNVQNTAVELYYTYSAQPCEGKFKSLLTSSEGVRLHGNSYEELFKKIEAGIDFYEP
jgi:nucleoside-diphosphate-sugar epimerase